MKPKSRCDEDSAISTFPPLSLSLSLSLSVSLFHLLLLPRLFLYFTLSLFAFIPYSSSFYSPLQSPFVSICASSSSSSLVFFLSELCSTPQPSPDCLFFFFNFILFYFIFFSFFLSLSFFYHHSCPSEENFSISEENHGRACDRVSEGTAVGSAKPSAISPVRLIPRLLATFKQCVGIL